MPVFSNHDTEKLATLPSSRHALLSQEKVSPAPSTDSLPTEDKYFVRSEVAFREESDDDVVYLNGEPVVVTGRDVSRFVVDIRDDGDDALTFRSFVLGTVLAGLGAALCQIYLFKPLQMSVSTVFLLLIIYTLGNAWAKCFPRRTLVEGTRFARLAPLLGFVNPGPFTLKEHVVASLIAATASVGNTAVLNFAVQRLYYDTNVSGLTAIFATFSTACFGYGLVGLMRPISVYPSEMVYWTALPTVSIFQALHSSTETNIKQVKFFWTAFTGMFVYEVVPAYIFPLLNGVNLFCLASQRASQKTLDVFTNIFGGAGSNEGLGLFSLSFDWQYIGSAQMSLPLVQQANSWVGYFICYIAILGIYYSNTWNSLNYPMLSTSIFSTNGSVYQQSAVFGPTFQLNHTTLTEVGLPAITGSNAWNNLTDNLAIGGLIAHVILFWGPYALESFKLARAKMQPDRHYQAMQKYKEVPWWWYMIVLALAFIAGLVVVTKGQSTLPWWSYIIALVLGTFITPFSTVFFARMGNGIATTQLMQMVAGAVNPGLPVANLYFSMWSHDVVVRSVALAADLKVGQYLKIPPRVMFLTQIWGALLGAIVNYAVMVSVVDEQRDILLSPIGTNVWSGQVPQSLNSAAVTWSLAKQLYGPDGPYLIVPLSLLIGMVPTTIQWLIWRRWPRIGPIKVDTIMLPIIYMYSSNLSAGVNSAITSGIIVGLVSQLWIRKYHPGWYKKYNYILGGAFDGGAQVMIFILSFAVFGASGAQRPFPHWAGNPVVGNVDYCNGNGALG